MSKIMVDLIDHMGSDLSVVNAARVSFDKESEWHWKTPGGALVPNSEVEDFSRLEPCGYIKCLSERDTKLIHYLAKHNHWSPFAHCFLSFRIKAPIFVARQLQKHQVGLSWNEVSRRYVDSEPEFYVPEGWRKRAENVKQGSSEEVLPVPKENMKKFYRDMVESYNELLDAGVCPEQARMVLPQSMMTEWIWSGSLYAFSRVCKLRLDPHTQKETREVAEKIDAIAAKHFPHSWNALRNN